jgi:hypothetical protein
VVTTTLSVGEHVITLSATNAAGLTGADSIRLTVLPAAPKPESKAELSDSYRLLLWAAPLAVVLLLAIGGFGILRKRRRRNN